MEFIDQFIIWINDWGNYSYLFMFLILVSCGFGVPISKDGLLIAAGIISGVNETNPINSFTIMLICCICGVVCGDDVMYLMGRTFGPRIQKFKNIRKIFSAKRFASIQKLFKKYGIGLIVIARFVPMIRGPIYVFCGMTRKVSLLAFTIINTASTIIYSSLLMTVGFLCAKNRNSLIEFLNNYKTALLYLIALAGIALTLFLIIKKFNKKKQIPN